MTDNDLAQFMNRINRNLDQAAARTTAQQDQIQRLARNQVKLADDVAHLMSMQNRTIRDLIEVRNRVMALERIVAYRTQSSDNNDPIVNAQD